MKRSLLCVVALVAGCAGRTKSLRLDSAGSAGTLEAVTAPLWVPLPAGWKLDPAGQRQRASVPSVSPSCKTLVWFDYVPAASLEHTKRLVDTESLAVRTLPHWAERRYTDTLLDGRRAVLLRSAPAEPDRGPYHTTETSTYLADAAGGVLLVHLVSESHDPLACLALHEQPAAELAAAFYAPRVLADAGRLSARSEPPPLMKPRPVPRDLEESFALLEAKLGNDDLARLRSTSESDLGQYHFGVGLWMRNNWGLWEGSPLARRFAAMGVYDPDDMSTLILRGFWQHLNGLPLTIARDAAAVKRHAEMSKAPEPTRCGDGSVSVHLFGLTGSESGQDRYVHAFACDGDGTYWAWELDKGWYRPDESLAKRIIELRTQGGIVEAPIEKRHQRHRRTDS